MPDPTILSAETGTRHRTAERVSKQTDALVVAISQRRDVVSLYVEGTKYILQEIPAVLAKANQGLGDAGEVPRAARAGLHRLTVLEFEGGGVLYDALTVLQRAELTTRMAVEVERYIVELGTEGRLIEMQLEETMVGVAADKSALIRDYSWRTPSRTSPPCCSRWRECRTRTCSTSAASPSCSATTASSTPSTSRLPRAATACWAACRASPSLSSRRSSRSWVGSRRYSRPPTPTSRQSRCRVDEGQGHPRGPAPAPGGRPGRPVLTELTATDAVEKGKEQPISELEEAMEAGFEEDVEYVCDFEEGDKVVYPHHGAGLVMKKESRS